MISPRAIEVGAMQISDEMVRAAWSAIVGSDIANICTNACIVPGDLRAALEAALSAMWQDISTAPKDGTIILGYWKPAHREHLKSVNYHGLTRFLAGEWLDADSTYNDYRAPDCWMPLPPPPKIEG